LLTVQLTAHSACFGVVALVCFPLQKIQRRLHTTVLSSVKRACGAKMGYGN